MNKVKEQVLLDGTMLPIIKTELSDYLSVCDELLKEEPLILMKIQEDLDLKAKKDKKGRLADKEWEEKQRKKITKK